MTKLNTQSIDIFAIPGIQDLSNENAAAVSGGVGPLELGPGELQTQIPTNLFVSTDVIIDSPFAGAVELRAGLSEPETTEIKAGRTRLRRQSGGVFLAITNKSDESISVTTE